MKKYGRVLGLMLHETLREFLRRVLRNAKADSRPTAGPDGLDFSTLSIVAPPLAICNDQSSKLALMIHGRPKSHRDAKCRRVPHLRVSQMASCRALA
jgi:hypothetical protein